MTAAEALSLVQASQTTAMGIIAAIKMLAHSSHPPQHADGTALTDADVDAAVAAARVPFTAIAETAKAELSQG